MSPPLQSSLIDLGSQSAEVVPKTFSKLSQIHRARWEDARMQVVAFEAKLAAVDEALSKYQTERIQITKKLEGYRGALRLLEDEMANRPCTAPAALKRDADKGSLPSVLGTAGAGEPCDASSPSAASVWQERHEVMARKFCNVLLRIKSRGALKFQDSMWRLWQAAEALDPSNGNEDIDPRTHSMYSCYHHVTDLQPVLPRKSKMAASRSPYGEVALRWLLSFEGNAQQLKYEHARIFEAGGPQAMALKRLYVALCKGLNKPGTRKLLQPRGRAFVPVFGLSKNTTQVPEELEHFNGSWAVLPLIWLPLALYVRSTTHLYEMLDRLHHMQAMSTSSNSGCNSEDELLKVFDRDERCYSYLIFAITAALQTMILTKSDLGRRFPYALLASSPPDAAKDKANGYPMQSADYGMTAAPIFRGIWVGATVDEERAMCQYSFQSFSRQIEGAAQVLSFYSAVKGSPVAQMANMHKHILIFVARQRFSSDCCFAMPVQLMDGPREEKSEMEVVLPPFARYEFEDDLSLTSADFEGEGPSLQAQRRIAKLRDRWKGFELPPLLLSMLQREGVTDEFQEIRALRPFVSVRFVRRIIYAEPMRKLFSDSAPRLYNFGDCE
jgi:hypothetical protein